VVFGQLLNFNTATSAGTSAVVFSTPVGGTIPAGMFLLSDLVNTSATNFLY